MFGALASDAFRSILALGPDVCAADAGGETVLSLTTQFQSTFDFPLSIGRSWIEIVQRLHPAVAALGVDKKLEPMPNDLRCAFRSIIETILSDLNDITFCGDTLFAFLDISPSFYALLPTKDDGRDAELVSMALMLSLVRRNK